MNAFEFTYSGNTDLKQFLEDVQNCENEVWFEAAQGDQLSLKSTLCQFILMSLSEHPESLSGAKVKGVGAHDREILSTYEKTI